MNMTEFQQRISRSQNPILIDFWASWCVPCQITKPILEKLAREYNDKVEFLAINADTSHDILQASRVYGIPTVITYINGKEIARVTGARSEANYRDMFEALARRRQITIQMTTFDRILRLGSGIAFIAYGISTSNWLIAGIGGSLTFLGIYDRCPIWRTITGLLKGRQKHP